jgi:hypothetical protein
MIKIFTRVTQFWFAAWLLIFGLNYWFEFVPQPLGIKSRYLHVALIESGLFAVGKVTDVIVGTCLLLNRFVPLALVLSVPVIFNIAWIHFVIEGPHPSGYFLVFCQIYLLFAYLPYYVSMLTPKADSLDRLTWAELRSRIA